MFRLLFQFPVRFPLALHVATRFTFPPFQTTSPARVPLSNWLALTASSGSPAQSTGFVTPEVARLCLTPVSAALKIRGAPFAVDASPEVWIPAGAGCCHSDGVLKCEGNFVPRRDVDS